MNWAWHAVTKKEAGRLETPGPCYFTRLNASWLSVEPLP